MALVNVLLLVYVALSGLTVSMEDTFDVTKYGARGDGKTNDSPAFLKAWKAACGASRGTPTLNVPSGKTFFLRPLVLTGPCRSRSIQIKIDGTIVAPSHVREWRNCEDNSWIYFRHVNGLNILGQGTLNARGKNWWNQAKRLDIRNGECHKPVTFRLLNSNSSRLTGLKFVDSGGSHINIVGDNDLFINKITIRAPDHAHNTDGIDIASSSRVQIHDSNIGTGDDCIAINTNSFNINISGIACGPGHGISVGSLGKGGYAAAVDGIHVQHCTFTKTLASARIKTWPGGAGYASNIIYEHITLNDVTSGIEINEKYHAAAQKNSAVRVNQVRFVDVRGTANSILLDCNKQIPCQQIYLQDVNIAPAIAGQRVNATCNHANVITSNVNPKFSCKN